VLYVVRKVEIISRMCGLFLQKFWPILVSFLNIAWPVLIPDFLYVLVEVEIKFAVNNRPGFRIYVGRGPTAYGIGSVAPVLGSKFFRVILEHGEMCLTGEAPLGSLPFMLELFLPFDRTALGKIRYRIIALQGHTIGVYIDRRYLG